MTEKNITIFSSLRFHSAICLALTVLLTSCKSKESYTHKKNAATKEHQINIKAKPKVKSTYFVDCNNKKASDTGNGSFEVPFKTIAVAAQKAIPGDVITVREGIYRERVAPAVGGKTGKPITYQAYPGEEVIIKGSNIWEPEYTSESKHPGIYKAPIPESLFKNRPNPFLIGISIAGGDRNIVARPTTEEKMLHTLGQIFINGKPAIQVQTVKEMREKPNSWIVGKEGKYISINFPVNQKPSECLVELSVRNRIFAPKRRGLTHITVRGFIMEHCANQGPFPQTGALSVRSGRNWIIENNTIRYAKTIGLDCGSETWDTKNLKETTKEDKKLILGGKHIIRNNTISDNGLSGISGWNHSGTKILNNIVERNNRLHFPGGIAKWEEWGAIKLHCTNSIIEGNLVRNNHEFGIWIDNGFNNAIIRRNVVINNKGAGIFLELGGGKGRCVVDNNIVIGTKPEGKSYPGHGFYSHDASNITVANNLFYKNSGTSILMRTITDRKYGGKLTETSNQKIFNNIIVDNKGAISLPQIYKRAKNNKSDYNYIANNGDRVFGTVWSIQDSNRKNLKGIMEEYTSSEKALNDWIKTGVQGIETWKKYMKMDINSAFSDNSLSILFNSEKLELELTPSNKLLATKGCLLPKVQCDFLGKPADEVGYSIPGPFQNINSKTKISLWPIKPSRTYFDTALPEHQNNIVNNWDINNKAENIWFRSHQSQISSLNKLEPVKEYSGNKILSTNSTRGTSASPAQTILFKAPENSWYDIDLSGALNRRSAHTAGYLKVTLYLLSPKMTKIKELKTFRLNTKGGFGNYPNTISHQDKIKIRENCYLALAVQVVAPGPAPAGFGSFSIDNFKVNQIK